jgi:thiol:disulfide interchange protein DsbD
MSSRRFWLVFFCLILGFPLLFANTGICYSFTSLPSGPINHKIHVKILMSQDKIHDSSVVYVVLALTIQDGWHINSATPSDETMIPTSVETSPLQGIAVAAIRYPRGREVRFSFSETPLDVYTGTVNVIIKLKVAGIARAGQYSLPVDVSYQACNDNFCLAPATLRVDVPIRIVPPAESAAPVDRELLKIIGKE